MKRLLLLILAALIPLSLALVGCKGASNEALVDTLITDTISPSDTLVPMVLALPDTLNPRVHYLMASNEGVLIESQVLENSEKGFRATNRTLFLDTAGRIDTISDFFVRDEKPYWVTRLFTVQCRDGNCYYLASCFGRQPNNLCYGELIAFTIDGNQLRRVAVVDGSDSLSNDIASYFSYQRHSYPVALYPFALRCGPSYNEQTHVLATYVAPSPTDRYVIYQFDGSRFVLKSSNAPRQGLNKYLKDYQQLECEFSTNKYRVRIDRIDDSDTAYRYAAWKDLKARGTKPDLVLYGGIYSAADDAYRFNNKGYIYSVTNSRRGDTIWLQVHKDKQCIVNQWSLK